jgi:flagellar protein FliO/FliZ
MMIRPRRGRGIALACQALAAASGALACSARAAASVAGAASAATPAISTGGSLAQAGLGLFGVIALILGLAWLARRAGLVRQGPAGSAMKIVGSTMLGARQRLVMVEVGGTVLVLGVSAGEIRTLHTLPAGSALPPQAGGSPAQGPGHHAAAFTPDASFGEKLMRSMQATLQAKLQGKLK